MARREVVRLEDDLDGGPADETVRFGLAGVEYEIDLSGGNAARLRGGLASFIAHARRTSRGPAPGRRTAASRQRSRDIRAWAKAQGIELSERGRIPADVVQQYEGSAGNTPRRLAPGRHPPGQGADSADVDVGQIPPAIAARIAPCVDSLNMETLQDNGVSSAQACTRAGIPAGQPLLHMLRVR